MPCILIGYTPSAKAYHLWDVMTGKVFNSFHVMFIEHINSLPSTLLPRMTVELTPFTPPSWDVGSLIPPEPAPSSPLYPIVSPSPPPPPPPSPPLSVPAPFNTYIPSTLPTITITDTVSGTITAPSGDLPPTLDPLNSSQNIITSPTFQNITTSRTFTHNLDSLTPSQNTTQPLLLPSISNTASPSL